LVVGPRSWTYLRSNGKNKDKDGDRDRKRDSGFARMTGATAKTTADPYGMTNKRTDNKQRC
jgi:hypothetical protein